jgi:RNA polymerase sigma-70 factor (ECF subfamily)
VAEPRDSTEDRATVAYATLAPFVRRALSSRGVHDADLDDVCHEVFLIVLHKSALLDDVNRVDLWLDEICRRVAAGYRKRAARKREVLAPLAPEDAPTSEAETSGEPLEDRDLEVLRRALEHLDAESRDLLALHEIGELPLTELAKLVVHDRKTVRKRLELGRRRLSALMRRQGDPSDPASALPASAQEEVPAPAVPWCAELEFVAVTPGVTIGLIGNTVITVWPGLASLEALQTLLQVGQSLVERIGGKFAYFAVVEASTRPPVLAGREKIVEALNVLGPSVLGYATALLGGMSWIAQPIMSGLVFLGRPRFPMSFFKGIEPAAAWLCAHFAKGPDGPLTVEALCSASETLRRRAI